MKLVAFTQQVSHGKFSPEKSSDLGVLDVIGRDRRLAWQNLGDLSRDQAMEGFIILLDKLCPLFKTFVEAQKRDIEEKARLQKEEQLQKIEEEKRFKELEEKKKKEEESKLQEENERRQIQDALNQQTYYQFKSYAEQQYPGNPELQGTLIRQLQEQHYHQFMQHQYVNQMMLEKKEKDKIKNNEEIPVPLKEPEEDPLLSNDNPATNDEDSDEPQVSIFNFRIFSFCKIKYINNFFYDISGLANNSSCRNVDE